MHVFVPVNNKQTFLLFFILQAEIVKYSSKFANKFSVAAKRMVNLTTSVLEIASKLCSQLNQDYSKESIRQLSAFIGILSDDRDFKRRNSGGGHGSTNLDSSSSCDPKSKGNRQRGFPINIQKLYICLYSSSSYGLLLLLLLLKLVYYIKLFWLHFQQIFAFWCLYV